MKKIILFTLTMIAGLSYAVGVDSVQPSTELSKENQLGQNIKLDVKVNIPKTSLKYVVYASGDNEKTISDTWELPTFYLSQDKTKAGFQGATPPKVYTRIVKDDGTVDTAATVKATYVIKHPDGFFEGNNDQALGPQGQTKYLIPTMLLPKAKLQEIAKKMGSDYVVSSNGNIRKGNDASTSPRYSAAKTLKLKSYQGVLSVEDYDYDEYYKLPAEDIAKLEALLGEELDIANGLYFEVQIQ